MGPDIGLVTTKGGKETGHSWLGYAGYYIMLFPKCTALAANFFPCKEAAFLLLNTIPKELFLFPLSVPFQHYFHYNTSKNRAEWRSPYGLPGFWSPRP